mmetsp:Transcript_51072/g.95652  ORF Transcript_51072/g.95652 Transcript_51072/m.95652 type:complete len:205 (-) Transcript_51072:121-735(-)
MSSSWISSTTGITPRPGRGPEAIRPQTFPAARGGTTGPAGHGGPRRGEKGRDGRGSRRARSRKEKGRSRREPSKCRKWRKKGRKLGGSRRKLPKRRSKVAATKNCAISLPQTLRSQPAPAPNATGAPSPSWSGMSYNLKALEPRSPFGHCAPEMPYAFCTKARRIWATVDTSSPPSTAEKVGYRLQLCLATGRSSSEPVQSGAA